MIAPASLIFYDVRNMKINISWADCVIGMSIDSIIKSDNNIWEIKLNFPIPGGNINFESSGFEQILRAESVQCKEQYIPTDRRNKILNTERDEDFSPIIERIFDSPITKTPIVLQIAKPYQKQDTNKDYCCRYKFLGIDDDKIYSAYGVDSLQSIAMAFGKIKAYCEHILQKKYKIKYLGSDNLWIGENICFIIS